ncbi:MAG: peroxiredoxin, partial [Bacteroidaceae bacterium]|nr:peroxiredoxin [Bacteroidaceae bacterium]
MAMKIGDKMPEILGVDQNGNQITLSQFKGQKLVLYTYPKDNTSGCTAEACSLRDHKDELLAKGFQIIGVSKDSAASHQKFIEKHELNFPLIADTDTTLLQAIGAWGEKTMCGKKTVGTLRTTYL